MNQSLQKIADFLRQTGQLSAEEKTLLAKAVNDVETEMAITAFKLDQTEKVKRTTSILLEETINELEQKRKTLESQNRELEIEFSLERVRTQAMSMNMPNDLTDICQIIYAELQLLGFHELRNAMINIYEEDKPYFLNYDYAPGSGKTLTQMPHNLHPLIDTQVRETKNAGDAFNEFSFSGEELKDFRELRKNNGETDDPKLEDCSSLHYYFYSIGTGSMGISTYSPIVEDKLDLLKRFRNVFNLAYQRYTDITKAEAQAREAQVEAALERVRSTTIGMQRSDELKDAAILLIEQIELLGTKTFGSGFNIWDKDREYATAWMAGEDSANQGRLRPPFKTKSSEDIFARILEAAEKGENLFIEEQSGKDLVLHYNYMISIPEFKIELEKLAEASVSVPSVQYMHCAFFSGGYLMFISYEPVPEMHDIFIRFAKVFDQTYTRFLDLQKAEAQVREAVKQSSLDRVRGQIASMRTTADLQRITPLIWHELIALGVPFVRCGVFIMNEETAHVQAFLSTPDGHSLAALDLPYNSSELIKNSVNNWRQGFIFKTHWNKEEFLKWMQSMVHEGQIRNTETYQGALKPPESLYLHFVPFAQGMLYVGNIQPLSIDELVLVKSLAEAFSMAYARYEDFKKLETAKKSIETTLSELKATQSQLIQSEKMASLGELTAGIAHEIQNPLNFVNNFSEINTELIDELEQEISIGNLDEVMSIAKTIKENEQKINHHGKRADAIVKGMLQHSRSSSGVKEPTDINALADEYLRLSYHGLRARDKSFNATMKTNFDETIGKINVVPQDIGRVILNLITNGFYAVDFKKKAPASSASGNYEPTIAVATKRDGNTISISVKDNGTGIPKQIRDKIFQPFFTTKPTGEGTGLGLSMSYDIITKGHGGDLQVETAEGEGSVFTIHLPI